MKIVYINHETLIADIMLFMQTKAEEIFNVLAS